MNYCDYYLKVLSLYILTRAMSPFDLWYSRHSRNLSIWNLEADKRSVVLTSSQYSSFWEAHPPVESLVDYSGLTDLSFIYDNTKTPGKYKMRLML